MKHIALILLVASGCTKQSEKYCAMHPEDTVNCADDGDGGTGCLGNDECIAIDPAKPVCTEDRMCVQCTVEDPTTCTEGRVCRGNNTCGDCVDHAECASAVCKADGRCADAGEVAYLATNGGGDACTQGAPCADASVAVATGRTVIKVSGTITNTAAVQFNARSTEIYADANGAFTRTGPGNIIEIMSTGTELAIYGLRIFGATGTSIGNGILFINQGDPKLTLDRVLIENNDGSGVRAPDGGDVTITRSVIANNFGNQGLLLANGSFSVTNTIITQNGKSTMNTGGAFLSPAGGSARFEFNTVADNISMGGAGNYRGITCSSGLDIANNIVVGNDTSSCDATFTFFSPGDQITGAGNMNGDPMFKSTSTPASPTYYRLMPTSPAKDKADMAATLTMDIDGNMRPIDGRSDMGADEVSP